MLIITKIKPAELYFLTHVIERYQELAQAYLNELKPGSDRYFDIKLNQSVAIHLSHRLKKLNLKISPPSHYKMTLPQHEGIVLLNAIIVEQSLQRISAFEVMISEKYKELLTRELL